MLKNIVKIEFVINDKIYHFVCDNDAPLEHVKEALFQCQAYVAKIEEQIKAQTEELARKKEEENKVEEIPTPEA